MKASVIKPGLLVSLKTSLVGGVSYQRVELEGEHTTEEGAMRARWETTRTIPDPDEFERAGKARSGARAAVSRACCTSAFGLLCPSDKEAELALAIAEAQRIVDTHNATAQLSRVAVFVLVGRVASDDVEAAKAIGSEVRDLLDAMKAGIAQADPEAIREAANRARAIGGMLSQDAGQKVADAISQARKVAREIVKAAEVSAGAAELVVRGVKLDAIEAARFAFLDVGEAGAVQAVEVGGRGIDLPATEAAPAVKAAGPIFAFELSGE